MAKHAHRLILLNKKTWKCMIDGCSFFVHLGLAHVLIGKQAICWGCDERFTISEDSLKEEKPRCNDCRLEISTNALEDFINSKLKKEE